MPSDARTDLVFERLAPAIERFRSTVVSTAEEVRGFLGSRVSEDGGGARREAVSLGKFAAGRIDYDRFAVLTTAEGADDPATLEKVEKSLDILRMISTAEADLFHVRLKSGERLRDRVASRLAEIGRGFAAARVAGRATMGSLNAGSDEVQLAPLGFERWNGTERKLAPPLVVELDGTDLHAGDLVDYLDGSMKIILVVNGPMAPAPLVRLITPSTFVLQTADATGLDRFMEASGPAVAALVAGGAALFVHDPLGGPSVAERIELLEVPEKNPKKPLGGFSAWQQTEELELLKALARQPEGGAEAGDPGASASVAENPVDKLAAWLLNQADLKNLE